MRLTAKLIETDVRNQGYNTQLRSEIIARSISSKELTVGSNISIFIDQYGPRGKSTVTIVGPNNKQIGNLPDDAAKRVLKAMEDEECLKATVSNINKPFLGKYSLEVTIETDSEWISMGNDDHYYQHYGTEDWQYVIEADGFARILKYNGPKAFILIVPDEFQGHKVKYIGIKEATDDEDNGVFIGYHIGLCHMILPDTITEFGEAAFEKCWLSTLNIPKQLKKISSFAFAELNGIDEITIPSTVEDIDFGAFFDSGFKRIQIQAHIDTLKDSLFRLCRDLETVELRVPIKTIGPRVFLQSGISKFTIPKTVTEIGFAAFAVCKNLEKLIIPASVKEIGERAFESSEQVQISVFTGSYAERWARENGIMHNVFNSDGSVRQGKAENVPGMITPNGPRWNGYYIGHMGRSMLYLRFWGDDQCRAYVYDMLDYSENDDILDHLALTAPIYSDHFHVAGKQISIILEYQDGTVNMEGTIGFGGNSMDLKIRSSEGFSDSISLSFEQVDLLEGKQSGYYWPNATL